MHYEADYVQQEKKGKLETNITNFLNMGQTRPLFVYFRSFANTMTNKGSTKSDYKWKMHELHNNQLNHQSSVN